MKSKHCLICHKEFFKVLSDSKKYWNRKKYCSQKCYGKSNIGKTGYWTGKVRSAEAKHKMSINRKGIYMGLNHWNWKNGRYKDSDGYVLVLKPEHPFCNSGGYVREHRLVIEKQIGRYLTPTEKVHHFGEKDDNRPHMLMAFKNIAYHMWFHRKGFCNPEGIIDEKNYRV